MKNSADNNGAAWKKIGAAAGIVATVFGSVQAVVTLPVRVSGVEKRQDSVDARFEKMTAERQADREILVRIEERVKRLQEEMRK